MNRKRKSTRASLTWKLKWRTSKNAQFLSLKRFTSLNTYFNHPFFILAHSFARFFLWFFLLHNYTHTHTIYAHFLFYVFLKNLRNFAPFYPHKEFISAKFFRSKLNFSFLLFEFFEMRAEAAVEHLKFLLLYEEEIPFPTKKGFFIYFIISFLFFVHFLASEKFPS